MKGRILAALLIYTIAAPAWALSDSNSYVGLDFDASRSVPPSEENRPVNVGVKYLIKAE